MEQVIKTYINKTEATKEVTEAGLPDELASVFLELIENTTDDSEVILMPASKDVFVMVFKTKEPIQFAKDLECAIVQAVTLAGVTTLTVLKKRKD